MVGHKRGQKDDGGTLKKKNSTRMDMNVLGVKETDA